MQIKTFLEKDRIPKEYKLIESNLFPTFRSGFLLFWNTKISQYLIYRDCRSLPIHIADLRRKLVHVYTLGNKKVGDWLLWEFRKNDIFREGFSSPKKIIENYLKELEEESEGEKRRKIRAREIQEELEKDVDNMKKGRTIISLNPTKILGIGSKTGKIYRLRKKKCDMNKNN